VLPTIRVGAHRRLCLDAREPSSRCPVEGGRASCQISHNGLEIPIKVRARIAGATLL